jgi:hypothetical protein
MKVAIAVIHGLGSQEPFYSVELKHLITTAYTELNEEFKEDDLVFEEIYWGDLIKEQLSALEKKVNYRGDLTYPDLRRTFMDYLGVSHAYRDGSHNPFYMAVQERIRVSLSKLAGHRRVDPESTPLVVLAHSLGGVIFSDFAWDLSQEQARSGGKLKGVTALEQLHTLAGFVTFGNPMALFAAGSPEDFDKPVKVGGPALPEDVRQRCKWLNFYDKDDVVAYPLKQLNAAFSEAVSEDIEINVGSVATSWNPACHTGYWEDEDFYRPVAEFLAELRAPKTFWK